MAVLCLAIYFYRRPPIGFLSWLFPARICRTVPFRLNLKLFMFNRVTGTALAVLFVALVTGQISALLNQGVARSVSHPMLATILILLTADFTTGWLHRLHRQFPVLLPIHALHPSAEELNPVTAYHHHPFYKVMGGAVLAVMQGLVQGIALGLIVGKVDPVVLPGSTAYDIQTVRVQPAS